MSGGATGGNNSGEVVPNGAAGLNATVKLVCDRYTPRPHLIVLKNQTTISDTDNRLYDQTFVLVTEFLRRNSRYNTNAILSFHRGAWYQQHTGVWHCHLCVPLDPYTEEVKGKFSDDYMRKLRDCKGKTKEKYDRYRTETVNEASRKQPINVQLPTSAHFEVAWIANEPRLAVCQRGSSRTLRDLFDFFDDIEKALKNGMKDYGSHFCLFVQGQNGTNTTTRNVTVLDPSGSTRSVQSVGYMQLGSTDYYRILPDNLKSRWLEAFKNNTSYTCET